MNPRVPGTASNPAGMLLVLVDLMLLLLFFSLIGSTERPEARLDMELAAAPGSAPGPASGPAARPRVAVWARLDPENPGSVYYLVEAERVDNADQLYRVIARHVNEDADTPVTLLSDGGVPFGWLLRALEECRRAHVRRVDFGAPASPNRAP